MSQMSATDAILYCRGPLLDTSITYEESKLINWMHNNLKAMRKLEDKFKPP